MSVKLWEDLRTLEKRLKLAEQRIDILEKHAGLKLEVVPTRDENGKPTTKVRVRT